MRRIALMVAQCLLLAGCAGLPRPREMGDMALMGTLGVDLGEQEVRVTAARSREEAPVLKGTGESLSAAAFALGESSDSYVFLGYVDHLLLGEEALDLEQVLGWFAQDSQLGLGAKVWLIRNGTAAHGVETEGVESRLSALSRDRRLGVAPISRTAGEVCTSLLERGCVFLPVLETGEEGLTPAGYALYRQGIRGYLTGWGARGLELLAHEPRAEILEIALPDNRVSVRLTGAALDCRPVFLEGELAGLELVSRVEGTLAQWQRRPTAREMEEIGRLARGQLKGAIEEALSLMALLECECVGLGSRVALAAPNRWGALEDVWQERFGSVPRSLEVQVSLGP